MYFSLSLLKISKIIKVLKTNLAEDLSNLLAIGISTDTRSLRPGEIFLALKGDKFDGHNFLNKAKSQGAIALITQPTQEPVELFSDIPHIIVPDTLVAYQQLASWWRRQFSLPVIGVTGSVGKTTTKELLASVLATQGKVHKSEANYNNEIGVAKTLLQLSCDHNFAVVEMGMRGLGEIGLLTEITQPTIGIITNVGTAHIGRLGSEEAIATAKCELLDSMPSGGIAILNHDSPRLLTAASRVWQGKTITYGLEGGDIQGKMIDSQTLRVFEQDFLLPLPGRHNALNYLGALCVAKTLNLDLQPLLKGVSVNLPSGRAKTHQLSDDILILDETYNAGLESMKASLQLLHDTPGKRHIAVLGAMKELGDRTKEFHQEVGQTVKALGIDLLLVLESDPDAQAIATGGQGIPTETFTNIPDLVTFLKEKMTGGDRLLFKASHSIGLTQAVEALLSTP